jgi:hypothetical protein
MERPVLLGALLVAVLVCSLAVSTPRPAHAIQCCDHAYYSTSQYWVMASTCADAQVAFRAAALPEAQATCAPEGVCAVTIPPCYTYDGMYVVDGVMYHGCKYYWPQLPCPY